MELPQLKIYRQSKRHFLVVPFPSMYRTIFVTHDGDELPGMRDTTSRFTLKSRTSLASHSVYAWPPAVTVPMVSWGWPSRNSPMRSTCSSRSRRCVGHLHSCFLREFQTFDLVSLLFRLYPERRTESFLILSVQIRASLSGLAMMRIA